MLDFLLTPVPPWQMILVLVLWYVWKDSDRGGPDSPA